MMSVLSRVSPVMGCSKSGSTGGHEEWYRVLYPRKEQRTWLFFEHQSNKLCGLVCMNRL